jgi:CO/xanthine dehydrogenase FAD-binding subunit
MRTAISELDLRRAKTIDDALAMASDGRTPIAGATDLFVALNFGTLTTRRFVDIWGLSDLRYIVAGGDTLVIGTLATYTDAIRSPLVAEWLPMLIDASRQVGGPQIQNRGTFGGNVANASPAGDSLPVFAAVDASVVLRSRSGERRVPFNQFYTGYRATAMTPGELIVAIEVPRVVGRQWFRKVGTRAAQAISKVVAAGVRGEATRFALGSVGPTTIRATSAEKVLSQAGTIDDACAALANEITPIDDVRSTADYRRRVSTNLLRRFWSDTTG